MPRVIGIDPGTVSIDLCGLDDGRLFLDRSRPTAEALADPARFVTELEAAGPLDLVAGPSGYGLPLTRVQDVTEEDLRLAFLAAPGETGGIGGLRDLVRALARSKLPVVLTPGVVHLPTVPTHRKVNRVDMGTADKVCAVALAIVDQARRLGCPLSATSFVLLELGGAFTAAVAVAGGRIVDGAGGSAGALAFRAVGAPRVRIVGAARPGLGGERTHPATAGAVRSYARARGVRRSDETGGAGRGARRRRPGGRDIPRARRAVGDPRGARQRARSSVRGPARAGAQIGRAHV